MSLNTIAEPGHGNLAIWRTPKKDESMYIIDYSRQLADYYQYAIQLLTDYFI